MASDTYLTLKYPSSGVYREKGSRFIANAFPVSGKEEIKTLIEKIRKEYHGARHHCHAYMLGAERLIWRTNDDGEPSGTAGRPILAQINAFHLTDILIVVTRYFGGTLLGVSGLINAYKNAAREVIINNEIIELTVQDFVEINFPYSAMNDVMRLVREENIESGDQKFESECSMKIRFRISEREKIMGRLLRIEGLTSGFINTG